jgi:hypothetical protein
LYLPFRFTDETLVYVSHISMRATWPVHLILLDLLTLTIFVEAYKGIKLLVMQSSPAYATSSLLCPNIFLSSLLSNTLNTCSSLGVRGEVSHHTKQVKL